MLLVLAEVVQTVAEMPMQVTKCDSHHNRSLMKVDYNLDTLSDNG